MKPNGKPLKYPFLSTWRATSEMVGVARQRNAPGYKTIASVALTMASLHASVWADTTIGASSTPNLEGAICTAVGTPAAGTNSWTCQVPNASGGFATITGVATNATGTGPDIVALSTLVTANLGANAILIGGTSSNATGANSISIAGQAVADNSLAIGKGAAAFGNHSVALGESAIAGKSGLPGVASSIAIGELAKATGDNSIAMGRNTLAGGDQSISIGIQAGAGSSNSIYSTFVGASAGTISNGAGNTAIGFGSGQKVVGIGNTAVGVAVGQEVVGDANIAIGWRAGGYMGALGAPVNSTVAIGFESKATLSGSVALGANAVTAAANPTGSAAVGTFTYAGFAGVNPLSVVSFGSVGSERQVTNVSAGRVTATSTDAVNGSQLFSVAKGINERIDALPSGGGGGGPDAATQGAVMYAKNPDNSVNSNEIQLNANGGGPTIIGNVADGKKASDAVNLGQLNTGLDNVTKQLRNEINGVAKDAYAGSAVAIAMANMPQAFSPGKSMLSAGVGTYKGESAISIGVSKLSEGGRWVIKFSGSADTRGNVGIGAGAGFQW